MFKLADGRKHLYQWDRDIKLLAIDENPIDEIHFCINPWDRPYRAEIKISDGCTYAIIPNTLLRQNKPIYAMPYCKTDNGIYTKYKQKFEIIPRSQPEDYINPDDEEDLRIWEDLEKKIPTKLSHLEIDMEVGGASSWNDLEGKPFYEESIEVTVLPETTLEFARAGYGGRINIEQEIPLIDGNIYKVIWDGVEYICECHEFSGNGVGDPGIFAYSIPDGFYVGAPFFIWDSGLIITKESGSHTFSITHTESKTHQLDEKFIPDAVKTHDWNTLNNRPFGIRIGKKYLIEPQTIVLDSKGYGTCVHIDDCWKHIHDDTPCEIEFDGEVYTCITYMDADGCYSNSFTTLSGIDVEIWELERVCSSSELSGEHTISLGVKEEIMDKLPQEYLPEIPTFDLVEMGLPVVSTDSTSSVNVSVNTSELFEALSKGSVKFKFNVDFLGTTVPMEVIGNGLYNSAYNNYQVNAVVCQTPLVFVARLQISSTGINAMVLDAGNGGASSWNDLKDKPFGESEENFLPEVTIPFTNGQFQAEAIGLIEGEKYLVNWNGEKYECVCEALTYMGIDALGIGNIPAFMEIGDSGHPFAIGEVSIMDACIIVSMTGESSATVSIKHLKLDTLNPKYIKDMYYTEGRVFKAQEIVYENSKASTKNNITPYINMVKGETFRVTINKKEYVCEVKQANDLHGNVFIFLGNLSLQVSNLPNTSEPFLLAEIEGFSETSGTTVFIDNTITNPFELKIERGVMEEVVHPIPEKYLGLDWIPKTEIIETEVLYDDYLEEDLFNSMFGSHAYMFANNIPQPTDFIIGEKYAITDNMGTHVAVATMGYDETDILFGDFDKLTQDGFTKPDCWYLSFSNHIDGFNGYCTNSDITGGVNLRVAKCEEKPNKLPEEYIPDTIARKSDIGNGGESSGGEKKWVLLADNSFEQLNEDKSNKVTTWECSLDMDGKPFECKEIYLELYRDETTKDAYNYISINYPDGAIMDVYFLPNIKGNKQTSTIHIGEEMSDGKRLMECHAFSRQNETTPPMYNGNVHFYGMGFSSKEKSYLGGSIKKVGYGMYEGVNGTRIRLYGLV